MNSELRTALTSSFVTEASVTSHPQADECIFQATDYWISTNKSLGFNWAIIAIDLTLYTTITRASGHLVTERRLGILQHYSFQGYDIENTLWIYVSDAYTETWVHKLIRQNAQASNNRILNVIRNDPGELIDLGTFKFGKQNKNP